MRKRDFHLISRTIVPPGLADEEEPKTDDEMDDFESGPGYFSGSSPLAGSNVPSNWNYNPFKGL